MAVAESLGIVLLRQTTAPSLSGSDSPAQALSSAVWGEVWAAVEEEKGYEAVILALALALAMKAGVGRGKKLSFRP